MAVRGATVTFNERSSGWCTASGRQAYLNGQVFRSVPAVRLHACFYLFSTVGPMTINYSLTSWFYI